MWKSSNVFAFAALRQPDVFFVNDLAQMVSDSPLVDHAIVLTDSQNVFEAASIAGLSAHMSSSLDGSLAETFTRYLESEEVFIDESTDAWFLQLDQSQVILSAHEVHSVFSKIRNEQCISVFRNEARSCARFFTARAFQNDFEFIEADIQWLNLTTNEMYR